MQIVAYMQTCPARQDVFRQTLADLARTDWGSEPIVVVDTFTAPSPVSRQRMQVRRILEMALRERVEFLLHLEDDLEFNRHLRANLSCWSPLRATRNGEHFFASLFNPGVRFQRTTAQHAHAEAEPVSVYGSQALLLSHTTVRYLVNCWGVEPEVHGDLRLVRLAARVCPIYFHVPSLVQHRQGVSTWGGHSVIAHDFQRGWRADRSATGSESPLHDCRDK